MRSYSIAGCAARGRMSPGHRPCWAEACLPLRRYTVYKDHITLEDYEIHDGMGLELYYQ